MTDDRPHPLFPLGQLLATRGVVETLENLGLDAVTSLGPYLARHAAGDWGELDKEDQASNDSAVASGDERLLSAYRLADRTRIWVITEADRSTTTVLLPEEY
jgi:hypothetical protein